jgi:ketopantoate reductase
LRICILGAGAPGCAIGAALSAGGSESGLVDTLLADGVSQAASTVSRLAPN